MFSYIYWLESKVPCIATRKSSKMMTRTRSGSHLYMLGYKDGLFFSLNYVKITYRLEYRLTGGYQQVCHDVGQVQSCDLTSFLKRFKIRAFSSPLETRCLVLFTVKFFWFLCSFREYFIVTMEPPARCSCLFFIESIQYETQTLLFCRV